MLKKCFKKLHYRIGTRGFLSTSRSWPRVMWDLPTTQMRMPFFLLVERVLAVSGSEVQSGW
jgi:hypothetical protein